MLQADLEDSKQSGPETSSVPQKMSDDEIEYELARLEDDDNSKNQVNIGSVNFSGISGGSISIGGDVATNIQAGGDIVGRDKVVQQTGGSDSPQAVLEAALVEWRKELDTVLDQAGDLDEDDKAYAKKTAAKVQDEAKKGEEADPAKMEGFLKRLGNMAPDILEVTAKTLQNPFAGVGLVLEKINDRIRLERAAKAEKSAVAKLQVMGVIARTKPAAISNFDGGDCVACRLAEP